MNKGKQAGRIAPPPARARRTTWIAGASLLAVLVSIGVTLRGGRTDEGSSSSTGGVSSTVAFNEGSSLPKVQVHKTPTCGCCSKWVDHLRHEGFEVQTNDLFDLTPVRTRHGVPGHLASCHTALVAGYVIEGHVPAADVKRLLNERPAAAGLAVPGMPIGSPGMEVPGTAVQPYEVFAFRRDGSVAVFSRHGSRERVR